VTLQPTSRLSYWIFPESQVGEERGAGRAEELDSTCVALDLVFTDGTTLRNTGVEDQYGNTLTPSGECGHLIPGQWNYVTADLSDLSGKTISRIDVGYEQNGAVAKYKGYIDDIRLSH
jgi:hypothetical protein